MSLPTLSPEQRTAALAKATHARRVRADFKQEVATGSLTASKALSKALCDDILSKLKVSEFLRSLPGIGPSIAANHLAELGIAETRRLRGLGSRQISELRYLCERVDNRRAKQALSKAS